MAIFLDRLSANALREDREKFKLVAELNIIIALSLSQQRARVMGRLKDILVGHARPYKFEAWHRVVDYQYADHPLSARGSVVSETGGRFNVGDIDPSLRPFPALYLASSRPLAFFEKYGQQEGKTGGKLSAYETVLSQSGSIASVQVRGTLEACVNLDDRKCLQKMVELFGTFTHPKEAIQLARRLKADLPGLASTPNQMKAAIMQENWREWAMHFDLPSNSQYFGQSAWATGVEAILYPSSKGQGHCLAVYPENFKNSDAFVEIEGPCPPSVTHGRLDQNSFAVFC